MYSEVTTCSICVDRRESCAFIAVDPLFERCGASRFEIIEEFVRRADRLRERDNKGFVIHKTIIDRFSYSATDHIFGGTSPTSERRMKTTRYSRRDGGVDRIVRCPAGELSEMPIG